MELTVSDLVVSVAGRDRGKLFYVIGTEGAYALLVNGKDRPIERPKRKKLKHLRRLTHGESTVAQQIQAGDKVLNAQLRRDLAIIATTLRSQNQGG